MKTLIAAILLASACATTGRSLPIESSSSGMGPTFDSRAATPAATAKAWFPMLAQEAALPSAARYQRELSTDRDRYDLTVRVCVAPNGNVASVNITEPSGSLELDRAAARDVAGWQFESFTAPVHVRVCKQLALGYEPKAEMSHVRIPLVRTSEP